MGNCYFFSLPPRLIPCLPDPVLHPTLQLLFLLFKLHIFLLLWDRTAAEELIAYTGEAVQSLSREVCSEVLEAQIKLHFNVLQVMRCTGS